MVRARKRAQNPLDNRARTRATHERRQYIKLNKLTQSTQNTKAIATYIIGKKGEARIKLTTHPWPKSIKQLKLRILTAANNKDVAQYKYQVNKTNASGQKT